MIARKVINGAWCFNLGKRRKKYIFFTKGKFILNFMVKSIIFAFSLMNGSFEYKNSEQDRHFGNSIIGSKVKGTKLFSDIEKSPCCFTHY
jgi:hypothetical protein